MKLKGKKLTRLTALLAALALVISMAACGQSSTATTEPETTTTAQAEPTPEPAEAEPEETAEPAAESAGVYIPGGRNVRSAQYDTAGYLQYADKAQWVGELTGEWYDIGYTIGEECADMIAASTDYWWGEMCAEKGLEETIAAMDEYAYQIDALDPTQTELLQGMTDGAESALSTAEYGDTANADYAKPFYRVLAASIFDCWLWGDPGSYMSGSDANGAAEGYINGDGCNSVAVKGSATVDGSTISSQVRHTQQAGLCYQASMVYEAEDSNTVWTVGNVPSANGLLLVNDKGVSISHHFGGATTEASLTYEGGPYYGSAYGVPWPNLLFYAIKEADTAEEALDILEHGSERYREITGRTTVLRDGAWNWMVCDEDTLSVIEVSPDRYAVRYAGEYTGEDWTDPDYIVCANHFLCPFSYDENDQLTDVPMTIFNANTTSEDRFWTLMWELEDVKGTIDVYTLQNMFQSTYIRDRETGEYIYVMEDDDGNLVPTGYVYGSVQGTLKDGGLTSGTNAAKIAVLRDGASTCYFCLGNPMDWQGEWDIFQFGG
ncbi:MAG: hypothetical protein LUE97_00080 [Oscillospiraceae bacterium]|nr:hypothetical protein [Oscillospiraceae bacterium]